jgi:hypothetical protein
MENAFVLNQVTLHRSVTEMLASEEYDDWAARTDVLAMIPWIDLETWGVPGPVAALLTRRNLGGPTEQELGKLAEDGIVITTELMLQAGVGSIQVAEFGDLGEVRVVYFDPEHPAPRPWWKELEGEAGARAVVLRLAPDRPADLLSLWEVVAVGPADEALERARRVIAGRSKPSRPDKASLPRTPTVVIQIGWVTGTGQVPITPITLSTISRFSARRGRLVPVAMPDGLLVGVLEAVEPKVGWPPTTRREHQAGDVVDLAGPDAVVRVRLHLAIASVVEGGLPTQVWVQGRRWNIPPREQGGG